MKINRILILFCLIVSFHCRAGSSDPYFIQPTSSYIYYQGRVEYKDSLVEIYWSGTQIEVNFKGTEVKATFFDSMGKNFYNVIVDNDSIWILRPDTIKKEYTLASKLADKEHNIKIYKRTEWNRGTTSFFGFKLGNGAEILPPPVRKKRKMEFYGNSITAGFGIQDYSGKDRSDSIYTNSYLTYAALTARYFDAECNYIVRSGIGLMVSWVPQIMPEIYYRTNPNNPGSFWDFSSYQPNIVVINLFQNDSWLVKSTLREEYKYRFGNQKPPKPDSIIAAYINFVQLIRKECPNSNIICMLGNLSITKKGSPWPGYVQKAVDLMNDPFVHTFFIPSKKTAGHPRVEEHRQMADKLIKFIDERIQW